jgi:DNA-binding Lrp family transcriptional regulator
MFVLETVFGQEASLILDSPIIESALVKQQRQAYVFINTEPESYNAALQDLQGIEGISEVYPSKGAYEIIAKVNGESIEYIRELIFRRIKNLSTIKSTLTLMVI